MFTRTAGCCGASSVVNAVVVTGAAAASADGIARVAIGADIGHAIGSGEAAAGAGAIVASRSVAGGIAVTCAAAGHVACSDEGAASAGAVVAVGSGAAGPAAACDGAWV